jgi:hypothetical protein
MDSSDRLVRASEMPKRVNTVPRRRENARTPLVLIEYDTRFIEPFALNLPPHSPSTAKRLDRVNFAALVEKT